MSWCSYNFIKFPMCIYNFNVAFRISTNQRARRDGDSYKKYMDNNKRQVFYMEKHIEYT